VRTSLNGLLLQVNSASSAFYDIVPLRNQGEVEKRLDWVIQRTWRKDMYWDSNREAINRFIRGLRVKALHNGICYTVWGLAIAYEDPKAKPSTRNVKFDLQTRNGQGVVTSSRLISVWDYMWRPDVNAT
jgi:hypothetical protein